MLPHTFIGSSAENLRIANALQRNLEYDTHSSVWTQGIFSPSATTLDSLLEELGKCDFGIFVFSPEDVTRLRSKDVSTVRDNVVFELGLFVGRLGKERTYILIPRGVEFHMPTDLIGMTPVSYDAGRPDGNWAAAVGPACDDIRRMIVKHGRRETHDVRGFPDMGSLYRYVTERIRAAKVSVDDLTWGPDSDYERTTEEKALYREYVEAIKRSSAVYREVMDISGKYRERAKEVLEAGLDNHRLKKPGDHAEDLPLLSFMIIDNREAVFLYLAPDRVASPGQDIGIAVGHPRIVAAFKTYFNEIWENSELVTKAEVGL